MLSPTLSTAFILEPDGLPLSVAIGLSYLLGAIPFGLVMARWIKGVDLRQVGSGNIGATNAMRVLGKPLGLVAFLLDCAKGFAPVVLLAPPEAWGQTGSLPSVLCAAAAVLGHCFPLYLGFKGGKGVATACGGIIALDPWVLLGAGLVWVLTLKLTRFVGLASILMGVAFPVMAWLRHPKDHAFVGGCVALALLVVVRHRANIGRMLNGSEPRAGDKPKEAQA